MQCNIVFLVIDWSEKYSISVFELFNNEHSKHIGNLTGVSNLNFSDWSRILHFNTIWFLITLMPHINKTC